MKEAIVSKGPTVKVVDSPVPEPNDDQVLIKVVVSGSNPKDWKMAEYYEGNAGDDIAGIIAKVGRNVTEFKEGDRVAAFHEMVTPHGSYAEYAVAWAHTTFHLPRRTPFEEAAAVPLAAMTAAVGLYLRLGLPHPWTPATRDIPLVVYGASSAVGAYALQLARRSNIHPLICVAGRARNHVETLIDRSRGDTIIDYRDGDEAVVKGLREALAGRELHYAFDAVSEKGSYQNIVQVLAKQGPTITLVLPGKAHKEIPDHVRKTITHVGCVHKESKDFGFVFFRYFSQGLAQGWFHGQPQEVVPGGLGGIQLALEKLKAGQASGVKYVFRIADTEGAGNSSGVTSSKI